MAAQIDRQTVLAPVQVVVRASDAAVETRILIVQFAVERPVRADELAQTQADERDVVGAAIIILHVVTD